MIISMIRIKKIRRVKGFVEMLNTYKILVRKLWRKIIWETEMGFWNGFKWLGITYNAELL